MNDRARVGHAETADFDARSSDEPFDAFYRDPRRLLMALAGGTLVLSGLARRSAFGLGLAVAGASVSYRAITGQSLESLIARAFKRPPAGRGFGARGINEGEAPHETDP